MPETYRSQHTGSIADLIGRRATAGSGAVRAAGDAAAQARMASGQAWGNAVQNIGGAVSGTLADFARQKAEEPNRQLRQRQSDALAAELTQMETSAAQKRIGELAQMVQASGYDPSTAEPIFRAIGKLTPDYEQPLMRSLMEPQLLKTVTDTLISQTPGYKAPEGFTLGPEQARYGPDGSVIAQGPAKPEPPPQPFTLGEGQVRYNPDGTQVAAGPAKPAPVVNLRPEDVLVDGRPAKAVFNPVSGTYSIGGQDVTARVKPIPPVGPAPERPSVWVSKGNDQRFVTPSEAAGLSTQGWTASQTRENPTEDERKTAGFYKRMEDAVRVMDEVEGQITQQDLYQIQSLPQEDLMGALNRGKMSEAAKRYVRALMQFTEARLRADSGAAISAGEYLSDRQVYGKQYGETPQLNSDRRSARAIAIDALKTRGGRALPKDDGKPKDNDPLGIRK